MTEWHVSNQVGRRQRCTRAWPSNGKSASDAEPSPLGLFRLSGIVLYTLASVGCASSAALGIREAPPDDIHVAEVQSDPDRFAGARVRWGGSIVGVENRNSETWIEVVGHDLEKGGRPEDTNRSEGRFLARTPGFLDPEIYANGRLFTVTGAIQRVVVRRIGEHEYPYPLVKTDAHHLWEPPRRGAGYGPYGYDPYWYTPRYPHYRFRHYHRHYYW